MSALEGDKPLGLFERLEFIKEFMHWRYHVYTGPDGCECLPCEYEVANAWYEESLKQLTSGETLEKD